MKVILLEDIETVGKMGDTVNVKDGYARNYLIPRKLALLATARNLKAQDHQIKDMERRRTKIIGDAQSLADKVAGVSLSFTRKTGEKGRLFGSVTNMDIADALKEKGLDLDRKNIILPEPIKSLGEFDIEIKLHHDVTPVVKVTVLPEDGEIPLGAMEEAPAAEPSPESVQEAAPESSEAETVDAPVQEDTSAQPEEETKE